MEPKLEWMNFLNVFIHKYLEVTGGVINAETMPLLNGYQHTLLGYHFFREEVLEGGFIQLIQNGYGPYIFDNPFAKAMRYVWSERFFKAIYDAKRFMMLIVKIWKKNVLMMSLWQCMSNTKRLMIWKRPIWIWRRELQHSQSVVCQRYRWNCLDDSYIQ